MNTIAQVGCYGCEGTGKIRGFGCAGMRCPCIAECEECGDDFAWGDNETRPTTCPACVELAGPDAKVCHNCKDRFLADDDRTFCSLECASDARDEAMGDKRRDS